MGFWIGCLSLMPKNWMSFFFGKIMSQKFPPRVSIFLNRAFAYITGIDIKEASQPIGSYRTIQDLFVRYLKPGSRPVHDSHLVSPCDGTLSVSSMILEKDLLFQAKGLYYSFEELVGHKPPDFVPWWLCTVYLAPHNYHRVHAPISGWLKKITYCPGQLWPVNRGAVLGVPHLFCQNERLIFVLEHPTYGELYLVMVGAMNVGKMQTPYVSDFFSNKSLKSNLRQPVDIFCPSTPLALEKGDELGVFMLGSTVLMIFDKNWSSHTAMSSKSNRSVCMGENLLESSL